MASKAKEMTAPATNMPAFMDPAKNRGNEEVTAQDMTIPRIGLIQDLSPQRKKSDPDYIPGAEEGMLFNTVSSELYGEKVVIVPCYFRREFAIWKDRDLGGGFRGAFSTEDEARMALAELDDSEHCEILETAQHFVLVVQGDKVEEAAISMNKSKMKAHRQLNSLVRMMEGDRFAHAYELRAVPTTNAAGQPYFNMDFRHLGWVASQEVYKRGEALYEAVRAGAKDVVRDDTE
jgi:hypothetical protein